MPMLTGKVQYGFLANVPEGRSLEGYMIPETLRFEINTPPIDVVRRLLNEYDARLSDELIAGIQAKGLTLPTTLRVA